MKEIIANSACSHVWIDPDDPPIARAPYAPIIGLGRRQMKSGTRYTCRNCQASIVPVAPNAHACSLPVRAPELRVMKHGIGYDLVLNEETGRLVLGIRCHTCAKVSYHPKDIDERFCGHCHRFHEAHLLSHEP